MMFELLLDVMELTCERCQVAMEELNRRRQLVQHNSEAFYHCAITSNWCAHRYRSYRSSTGRLFGWRPSQALGARLRSACPYGTSLQPFRNNIQLAAVRAGQALTRISAGCAQRKGRIPTDLVATRLLFNQIGPCRDLFRLVFRDADSFPP